MALAGGLLTAFGGFGVLASWPVSGTNVGGADTLAGSWLWTFVFALGALGGVGSTAAVLIGRRRLAVGALGATALLIGGAVLY